MYNLFLRFTNKKLLIFLLILFNASINARFINNTILAETIENEENLKKSNSRQQKKINSDYYILDSGDVIFVKFMGAQFMNSSVTINQEGQVNLPEINKVFVSGNTIKELENFLTAQYKDILFDPNIDVSIISYRPVEVYVMGEVKRPGIYNFPSVDYGLNISSNILDAQNRIPRIMPASKPNKDRKNITLYDVLQITNGVTNYADLSKVEIVRKNSNSQGGGKIKTNVNLLSLLLDGNQEANIRIYDGDVIRVKKGEMMIKEQILNINKSNLSPLSITVFITGNVIQPGSFELLQGSSLTQAIASSGGKKLLTGKIEFIRFNADGTTTRKVFSYDPNAPINSETNPILMTGDIINVNKTTLGNATEVISEVASPFFGVFGLYEIFTD